MKLFKATLFAIPVFMLLVAATMAEDAKGKKPGAERGKRQAPSAERMKEILEKFDANKDGKLDEKEKAALMKEVRSRQGEGKGQRPSREEMIKKFDKNKDGELNKEEMAAARKAMAAQRGAGKKPGAAKKDGAKKKKAE
ncbi:MAG: EF-hand domain-containing protein [Pirellulales bacterium]|jgi:hypothetical protein